MIVFELEVEVDVIGAVQSLYPVAETVLAQLTHPAGPVFDDNPYVKSNGLYPAEQVYPV